MRLIPPAERPIEPDPLRLLARSLRSRAEGSHDPAVRSYCAVLALAVDVARDKGRTVKSVISSHSVAGQVVPRGMLARMLACARSAEQRRAENQSEDILSSHVRALQS